MKRIIFISILFVTGMAADATAACTDTRRISLKSILEGKTACKSNGSGGFEFQEYHDPRGDLIDYKLGPKHPLDPSKTVGKWLLNKNGAKDATVTYNYGSGGVYTYSLHSSTASGPFSFCNGSTEAIRGVMLKKGKVAC